MADATDSAVLENPINRTGVAKTIQNTTGFIAPTPEERKKELEEISGIVKGLVEYIPIKGRRITFGQQITEVHHPKPSEIPASTPQDAKVNRVNHQNNVALLRNTFHRGVWYDSSGIPRPKKK